MSDPSLRTLDLRRLFFLMLCIPGLALLAIGIWGGLMPSRGINWGDNARWPVAQVYFELMVYARLATIGAVITYFVGRKTAFAERHDLTARIVLILALVGYFWGRLQLGQILGQEFF